MNRTLFLPALLACATHIASAQPYVDLMLEHDDANDQLRIFVRANGSDFGDLVSSISFTVRWPESSAATLGFGTSPWCPYPNSAFQPSPASTITPGNGFKYRNWNFFGLGTFLSATTDDGGCGASWLADTWIEVVDIPVNNDPGATSFIIAEDQYAIDNNLLYYISLNGLDRTGGVFSGSTAVADVAPVPSAFIVAPNPATSTVAIAMKDEGSMDEVQLIDASGRVVLRQRASGARASLGLETIEQGAYQLVVRSGDRVLSHPLVIAR